MSQTPFQAHLRLNLRNGLGEMPHTAFRCKVERLVKRCIIVAKQIFSEMTHF